MFVLSAQYIIQAQRVFFGIDIGLTFFQPCLFIISIWFDDIGVSMDLLKICFEQLAINRIWFNLQLQGKAYIYIYIYNVQELVLRLPVCKVSVVLQEKRNILILCCYLNQ